MTTEQLYSIYQSHPSLQTDTRKLRAGDLFFALKGENFNGNAFAKAALDAGAEYAIIDEANYTLGEKTILVPDVLTCLQELALYHRRLFTIPFIAITGSNGKTTTKELVHAVLSTTYRTYTTEGNLNNHIGIPLTLLKIRPDAEMAVIEMGANHLHEIEGYCQYVLPTHGLITNIGKAHLEGFGSADGVRKGKGELFDFIRQHQGTAFVLWDDLSIREIAEGIKTVIRYGSRDTAITGRVLDAAEGAEEAFLTVALTGGAPDTVIHTRLVGDYNLPNVLAALAVGLTFGVSPASAKKAIEAYTPANSRSQLLTKDSNHIILDAYNANPSSMRVAIENFARLPAKEKVLLLGSMAELGQDSPKEHQALIDLIACHKWKAVVLVGEQFGKIHHPYLQIRNSLEAHDWLAAQQFTNTHLLIKGSRSMQMEKVL